MENSSQDQKKIFDDLLLKIKNVFSLVPKVVVRLELNNALSFALLFLQGVSAVTTIEGASIILSKDDFLPKVNWSIPILNISVPIGFPIPTYFVFGLTVQLLLILLLIFKAANNSHIRKWFSALILILMSIYASFFSIYNQLNENELKTAYNEKALAAHSKLKKDIYIEAKNKLEKDLKRVEQLKRQITEEEKGLGTSGISGFGEQRRKLKIELENKQEEINNLTVYVDKLRSYFEIEEKNLESKKSIEIFRQDRSALTNADKKYLSAQYQRQELDKKIYTSEPIFLVPFNKILEKDQSAIVALIIATIIDGLVLILSSVRENVKFNGFNIFEELIKIIGYFIIGYKRFWKTLSEIFNSDLEGFSIPGENELKDGISMIILLNHKGYDFLIKLYHAIDFQTKIIDLENLINKNNNNDSTIIGYRILIDAMQSKRLNWIQEKEIFQTSEGKKQWKFTEKTYDSFTRWISREIQKQKQKEIGQNGNKMIVAVEISIP